MTTDKRVEILEHFANIEHERWSKWQAYLHGKLEFNGKDWVLKNEWFERWNRQIHTPYSELSESEKESDREQVRPYLEYFITQQQKHEAVTEKYQELLLAVENKYTGETRHQTALRLIKGAQDCHGLSTE